MKLGSLFDGSGGFPLAGTLCGIEPIWAAEVEPYPIAVTRSRFPYMKHLGDISKINGAEIEPVDIITFGSPCQDLSVAGKRAGLKHEDNGDDETTRSGLFMEAVRIIKEMREKTNGEYPRFAVWENVPGAFSSNKGEDFRIVLEELIKVVEPSAVMPAVPQFGWAYADSYCGNGWSLAYRVLDAQYWGVPQRRRRIYLVADFGGECAREILFEREGLRGYFAESGTPWKAITSHAERSLGTDDRKGEIPYTLKIRSGVSVDSYGKAAGKGALIQKNLSATLGVSQDQYLFQPMGFDRYNQCSTGDKVETLRTPGGGDNYPTVCYGLDGYNAAETGDKAAILGVNCGMSTGRNGVITLEPGIAAREGGHIYEDVSGTLRANAGDNRMAVAYGISSYESNSMKSSNPHSGIYEADTSRTLDLNGGNPACNQGGIAVVEPIAVATQQGGAEITKNGICPTITAAAGMSGNNQPWICQGFDAYNQALTGDKSKTLNSAASDADHVPCVVVDSIGGQAERGWESEVAPTLKATHYKMPPCIVESVGFCPEQSAKTRGIGYEEETSPTLRAGVTPGVAYVFENHSQDTRYKGPLDVAQTVSATYGMGGNNQPFVVEQTPLEVHGVAYGFDPGASRDVGVLFIEECGKTLTNGTCPGHHDGVVIATYPTEQIIKAINEVYRYSGVGSGLHIVLDDENIEDNHIVWCLENSIPEIENDAERQACEVCAKLLLNLTYREREQIMDHYWRGESHPALTASKASFFMRSEEELASTLVATDYKDPQIVCCENPIAIDRAFFNQGQNALYAPQTYEDGTNPTLVARGPSAVAVRYIVRRLTPTECARLQGFADRWGDIDAKSDFTDEEYRFWHDVRNTHAAINGKQVKEYNKKQMLAWYNKLNTDSAEYKMWGNGIALPTALYAIQGIADVIRKEHEND